MLGLLWSLSATYMGVESGGTEGDTSPPMKRSGGNVPSKNTYETTRLKNTYEAKKKISNSDYF